MTRTAKITLGSFNVFLGQKDEAQELWEIMIKYRHSAVDSVDQCSQALLLLDMGRLEEAE